MFMQRNTEIEGLKESPEISALDNSAKSNDKPFSENPRVVFVEKIAMPVILLIFGSLFTWQQSEIARTRQLTDIKIANERQDTDSADKAIETRENVLTEFSKTISALVTDKGLRKPDPQAQDLARGQAFIALRRLNVPDEEASNSKVDRGELKGLLIRYLYDAELIFHDSAPVRPKPPIVNLAGANINKAVLENAWLRKINLKGTWLQYANFKETNLVNANLSEAKLHKANFYSANLESANLESANLKDANLKDADLRGADLRFAKLQNADLSNTKLTGACYVEGTETTHFPTGFDPKAHGMVPMAEELSNSKNQKMYQPCPAPKS